MVALIAVVVEVANMAPECEILAPLEQSVLLAGEDVEFQGTAIDAESAYSALGITWTSSIDGVIDTTSPSSTGELAFSYALSSGSHTLSLIVEDEKGASCVASRMAVPKRARSRA